MLSIVEKSTAMRCFGELTERVQLDPDPEAANKLMKECNCEGCENLSYCFLLACTLEDNIQ
jgi:hypothetical protein